MQSLSHATRTPNKVNGILLLNKPAGCTSQQAVSRVKRLFNLKKAGHTGSLDPIATGLLPICLNEATKFSQFLLTADKHYRVEAILGQRTDTRDSEGTVIEEKPVSSLQPERLQDILSSFLGNISQVPPMFSAIKHQGKPLYHWARQGIELERSARPVTIYELKLLDYQTDRLALEVRCSKGTYIRTLVDDIGIQLGCGAHVTGLSRLSVGQYTLEESVYFETLESLDTVEERIQKLLPLEAALPEKWPTLPISEAAAFYLRRGQALTLPNMPPEGWVRLLLKSDNQMIGVGQILPDGRVAPYRLICEESFIPS